jgi:hypothetical protein
MIKLYQLDNTKKQYWETWDSGDGIHTIHFGDLGSLGKTESVKSSFFKKATSIVQKNIDIQITNGFKPVLQEDHFALIIEYTIDGMGTSEDLDKRHRLEALMNETLGWTGLGACDGGSTGSGTMEVCNYVVDFDLAKAVIESKLANTEFSNYSRLYIESA